MERLITDLLITIGATPVDIILLLSIIGREWAGYYHRKLKNEEIKDLTYKYETLNTNVFSIDKHTSHNGFKRGNSQGDFMLDWDGKPEKLMTVNMFHAWVTRQKKKQLDVQKLPEE